MSADCILAMVEHAGIALPVDRVEDQWRSQVWDYLCATNISRKSVENARHQLSDQLGTVLSNFEVEVFASGVRFEEIFLRRFALRGSVQKFLRSIACWRESEAAMVRLEIQRSMLLALLDARSVDLHEQRAKRTDEWREHSWANVAPMPGSVREYAGHRPETSDPRWGKAMQKYLSPKRPQY